uniref:Ankyrin repeat protein n=1 Tax=Lotharella oceanica TaxID=641309 RepID=A0A7S2TFK0_9EUKA|mmetsp:Transcript_11727/g.22578  ORF Transcript_11727/g.22578 Transcript_11727/m.22578 type:complete len:186 (+) Transcript_11727:290-847(+)
MIKYLVECKSDIEATCAGGYTPLLHAVEENSLDTVRYLVEEAKANVNAGNPTNALSIAVGESNLVLGKYLIEAGAEINLLPNLRWNLHPGDNVSRWITVRFLRGLERVVERDMSGVHMLHKNVLEAIDSRWALHRFYVDGKPGCYFHGHRDAETTGGKDGSSAMRSIIMNASKKCHIDAILNLRE